MVNYTKEILKDLILFEFSTKLRFKPIGYLENGI